MAETPSNMMALGTKAPDFSLLNVLSNKYESLNELKSNTGTVILFICNHCPYVKHIQDQIVQVAKQYQPKGIRMIAISSNDATNYPGDSKDHLRQQAEEHHFPFPYLYDETQTVAKSYQAACTPDFYLFDKEMKCVYRGRFDGARPGNKVEVNGEDLCAALDHLLAGKPINPEQKPSLGCNIKWKK